MKTRLLRQAGTDFLRCALEPSENMDSTPMPIPTVPTSMPTTTSADTSTSCTVLPQLRSNPIYLPPEVSTANSKKEETPPETVNVSKEPKELKTPTTPSSGI